MGLSQSSSGAKRDEETEEIEARELDNLWTKENSRALEEMREEDKATRQRVRADNERSAARRAEHMC